MGDETEVLSVQHLAQRVTFLEQQVRLLMNELRGGRTKSAVTFPSVRKNSLTEGAVKREPTNSHKQHKSAKSASSVSSSSRKSPTSSSARIVIHEREASAVSPPKRSRNNNYDDYYNNESPDESDHRRNSKKGPVSPPLLMPNEFIHDDVNNGMLLCHDFNTNLCNTVNCTLRHACAVCLNAHPIDMCPKTGSMRHTKMSLPLSFLLPPPPASWDSSGGHDIHVHKRIAPVKAGIVEPVGTEFLAVLRRNRYNRTLTQDWELEKALKDSAVDGDDDWVEEPETKAILASDPNNWKHQDHYAILGISRLRWTATDEQIKKAYRKKVLKHHPDKKAATTGKKDDDAYFKCLQKAWEIMTDPALRRQWDSCDPTFDDDLPTAVKKGSTFYETFGPAFQKEARFSKDPAVLTAKLGDDSSSREEVEAFYQLWINFDSWRTFEFMDEEEEGGLNSDKSREAKRYLDKKNRAARSRLKKEDNQRVIKFIETAMKLDPRIQKIKEEERAAREAKKYARENAGKKEAEDAAKRAAEVKATEEVAAAEEKERRDVEKKEREAHKKLARKARNAIKTVFSSNNFFLDAKAKPALLEEQQTKFDALIEVLELWQLEEFKERLDDAVSGGIAALNAVLVSEHELLNNRKEAEAAATAAAKASGRSNANSSANVAKKAKAPWSTKEVSTLVKAVKTFPGGTVSRWEKVAEYVNLHGVDFQADSNDRSPDECIKKSKEMQDASVAECTALQSAATEAAKKKETILNEKPSNRVEVNSNLAAPAGGNTKAVNPTAVPGSITAGGFVLPENDTWSAAQQVALEDGLKKYPATQFTAAPAKRWEEIAKEIDGKNVKEVKQRMKDLADALAKSKKPAGKSGKK
ncbi:hypothetical protein HK100_006776 [Physocladia obscura]|uniref:DnaJ homolog subfamily C member 2 n=1 Tax=Physocladia obscura TaxID=109957 RepID=A0AAD5T5A9_9FUNG|nr:hypothetical protein HK100_006776 [Physocladia obscura]